MKSNQDRALLERGYRWLRSFKGPVTNPVTVKIKKPKAGSERCRFPSITGELPYRYFDKDSHLFFNTHNTGLLYQMVPMTAGNEMLAEQLDALLRTKVSDDFTLQLVMVKHNQVGHWVDEFAAQFKSGEMAELDILGVRLADFYKSAAKDGFKSHTSESPRLTHSECFIVVDAGNTQSEALMRAKLCGFRTSFEAALTGMGIGFKSCDASDFLRLMSYFLSQDLDDIYPARPEYHKEAPLNHQTHPHSFDMAVHTDGLELSHDKSAQRVKTAVSVLTLSELPASFHLWDNINNSHYLFEKGVSVPANHIVSVTYQVEEQARALSRINRKTRDFDKKAKSEYATNVAGTEERARTFRTFREELAGNKSRAVKMLYNVVLFSTPENKARDIEKTINSFSYNGLALTLCRRMQLPYFMVSMPFMFTYHLDKDFSLPRMMWSLSSWNATQYMPVLSDWTGLDSGVLMPTLREQFALIDPFDSRLGTNYNIAVTGTSGGGKSFAVQMLMLSVLFAGGDVFVIDIGGSYKKLCQVLGGTYLEYDNLSMNPFTHISELSKHLDSIVDLFELLSCARVSATDDDRGTLRAAIIQAFEAHAEVTTIDNVVSALKCLYQQEPEGYPSAKILAKNLQPYCTGGEHGQVFNAPSKLSPSARFIVVDLEAIKNNASIQSPVLLSVIAQFQQRMFDSDRSRKKMCVIDEAWKFFTGDAIATQFITEGFRTGRRHNASFVTITQGIGDYYNFSEARAAWDNSSLKLVFLQDQAALLEHIKKHDTFTALEVELLKKFPKAKMAGYSEVMIKAGGLSSFHRLFVDNFTRILLSSDGHDVTRVERYVASGLSFIDAVSRVASDIERGTND